MLGRRRATGVEDQRGKHIVYMYGIVEEQILKKK